MWRFKPTLEKMKRANNAIDSTPYRVTLRAFHPLRGIGTKCATSGRESSPTKANDTLPPMRLAIILASMSFLLASMLNADELLMPEAIYGFEVRPSLERLNLAEGLSAYGALCLFKRSQTDGSTSKILIFSDSLAEYLGTLQVPSVNLTFLINETTSNNMLATIHGKRFEDFKPAMYLIRKEKHQ
jgi:hypothetical protein